MSVLISVIVVTFLDYIVDVVAVDATGRSGSCQVYKSQVGETKEAPEQAKAQSSARRSVASYERDAPCIA